MSIYTQEAVAAEVNYRLEVAQANRQPADLQRSERPSWWRRLRAESGTRRVVRATPATQ